MKFASDLRSGNVIMIGRDPMVVMKAEYNKSGRNAAVMKLKLKNLLQGTMSEGVYKADERFEDITLDRKEATFSYENQGTFVFMDTEYNQHEIPEDDMGDALKYVDEGMPVELVFYEGKAISIEIPIKVNREIISTEPAVRGDTSGKVMKPAKLKTGHIIQVPAFIEEGELIEIDTRTDEYISRAKKA
jgi:elongation factor P